MQTELRLRLGSAFAPIFSSSLNTHNYRYSLFFLFSSLSPRSSQSQSSSLSSSYSQWFSILRSAVAAADLSLGKHAHALIITSGRNPDRFLTNNLINMYSKCASLVYARHLFDRMPERDLVSWNSILAAVANSPDTEPGKITEGFSLFRCFLRESFFSANKLTLAPILKLCSHSGYVRASQSVHGYALKLGLELDEFLSCSLVNIYCKFGRIAEARGLFDRIPERDVLLWNVMFKAYAETGLERQALLLFSEFHRSGLIPDYVTMRCVLPGVDKIGSGEENARFSQQIQAYATKLSFYDDTMITVSWNKRLSEHIQAGENGLAVDCFLKMIRSKVKFDTVTIVVMLSMVVNTNDLSFGQQIHGIALKSGLDSDVFVANSLINVYSKSGTVRSARKVFKNMGDTDLVSWNSMISSCSQSGMERESVTLFQDLLGAGLVPDQFTLASVLRACSSLEEQGSDLVRQIHVHALKRAKESDKFVSTTLIDAYSRRGEMGEARIVFEKSSFEVASWNAMMFGYVTIGDSLRALKLLTRFHSGGRARPDGFTLATAAKASGLSVAAEQGKQIHGLAVKIGLGSDICVGNGILDMYLKCGETESAERAFSEIPVPDDVAWNTMISGCIENGDEDRALSVLHRMRLSGIDPDEFTFATLVKACSSLSALEHGRQIHANAIKLHRDSDAFVATSLVDMYAKCGNLNEARVLFRRTKEKSLALWNAMLVGLAQHGDASEARSLFEIMVRDRIVPDKVTFIGVISACSHAGLVSEAREYFSLMKRVYGIEPEIEHYACLVDALGRSGQVGEAEEVISSMPFDASASMYRALLGACRVKGDADAGKRIADRLLELEPGDSSAYVLLSNIYASAERWNDATAARRWMRRQNVKKEPGFSWIEVKKRVHLFVAYDKSHPESDSIYAKVEEMMERIRGEGYVADMGFVLADVESEEKERALYHHSEKLAVAFGLMASPAGSVIRVIKNLRVCGDCHNAIKYVSKAYQREIVLRDANRFHSFRDGICSCGDYW